MISEREPTAKPLVRDRITQTLREFVESRREDKPVRIESERELAERLNVSRLSLRSALQTLADEGLVAKRRGSGTYIVPTPNPRMVDLIAAPDIKPHDPFYSEFMAEFSRFLAEQSIHLRMLHLDQLPVRPTESPLIVVGLVDNRLMRALRTTHPVIVATQSYPDSVDISQICFDDYRIGSEAATVFYEAGHRDVVHLAGPDVYASARERRHGFERRATSLGLRVNVIEGKMNWGGGFELADQVGTLFRGPQPLTGVFAANDWMALGLMQRLREDGIQIPRDLSVVGVDDIHLASEAKPHLSTFRWDMKYLIRELFAHLHSIEAGKTDQHKRILLPAQFVGRESFGAVNS